MAKIPDDAYHRIMLSIITKLVRRDLYGNSYTPLDNVLGGIAKHDRGYVDDVVKELEKEKLIILHKNRSCISLNTEKKKEIGDFVSKYAPELSWKFK